MTYLSFLKGNIEEKWLKNRIRLTLATFQDDFMPICEKLIEIEAKRFLNVLTQFVDLLTPDKIVLFCKNFSFDINQYDYLIGYDLCINYFQQLSLFSNNHLEEPLDVTIGNRRIKQKRKLNIDKKYTVNYNSIENILPILKQNLQEVSFHFVMREIDNLKDKQTLNENALIFSKTQ